MWAAKRYGEQGRPPRQGSTAVNYRQAGTAASSGPCDQSGPAEQGQKHRLRDIQAFHLLSASLVGYDSLPATAIYSSSRLSAAAAVAGQSLCPIAFRMHRGLRSPSATQPQRSAGAPSRPTLRFASMMRLAGRARRRCCRDALLVRAPWGGVQAEEAQQKRRRVRESARERKGGEGETRG